MFIRGYTSLYENFEYSHPHSNALLQFRLKVEHCKPHKEAHDPRKCGIINDIKLQIFDIIQSGFPLQNQVL